MPESNPHQGVQAHRRLLKREDFLSAIREYVDHTQYRRWVCPKFDHNSKVGLLIGSYIARWIAPIQPDPYLTFLATRSSVCMSPSFIQTEPSAKAIHHTTAADSNTRREQLSVRTETCKKLLRASCNAGLSHHVRDLLKP